LMHQPPPISTLFPYTTLFRSFYPAKDYELQFIFNDLVKNKTYSHLDKIYPKYPTETNQWLAHPKQRVEFSSENEWRVLSGLPERSEEHTSELQSRENLVCRLL